MRRDVRRQGAVVVKLRTDAEAVAKYREMLMEHAPLKPSQVAAMSDEKVIELTERILTGVIELGRQLRLVFEELGAALVRAGRVLSAAERAREARDVTP